jgi:hypothetical protein
MRSFWVSWTVLAGCMGDARLPASYFAETAHVVAPGHVAITAAGGGGGWPGEHSSTGSGVGGRVRVGIGDDQEVGVEAAERSLHVTDEQFQLFGDNTYTHEQAQTYSAALSWKREMSPLLALVGNLGGTSSKGDLDGKSVNGSFGVVGSRYVSPGVQPYGGFRVAFGVPIGAQQAKVGTVAGADLAGGFALPLGSQVHLYLELDVHWTMDDDETSWVPIPSLGGTGGLALEL